MPGIGVALREAVPERVRNDQLSGERDRAAGGVSLGSVQTRQRGHPRPHHSLEVRGSDRLGALGVLQRPGEQRQASGRGLGEGGAHFLLLGNDDGRLPVMDREAAAGLDDLGHVVDEHGTGPAFAVLVGVLVVVEAGEAE